MSSIRLQTLVVGPFQCNCMIVACEATKEAVLVDPGDEAQRICQEIESSGWQIKHILHTHAHFDHIVGTSEVCQIVRAPTYLHQADEILYKNLPMQGRLFGMTFKEARPIDYFLEDNQVLKFGHHQVEVLHTPGHSPGSVAFRIEGGEGMLLSGDTLFKESIGRSDLWGGDGEQLLRSIRTRLLILEDELPVYPGHGPNTTIGHEKRFNPFLI